MDKMAKSQSVGGGAQRYDVEVTPANIGMFEAWLATDGNVLDVLWEYVCPEMTGRRRARTAVLLLLTSEDDRGGFRGRQHVLLYDEGVGGTGKSILGDWVKYAMPDGYGVGPDASKAGLKFNGNTGEPGKLNQADGGVLRIEEFEKFEKEDRDATYEAMSEGYFEVDKGGVNADLPAQVRVLALSNNPEILSGPMRTRFDFAIEMDEYDADETITVGEERYEAFGDAFINGERDEEPEVLPQYLSYVGDFRPDYPEAAHEEIVEMLETLVTEADMTGDIREKEAYIRAAYCIAKLNLRDITPEDWAYAVDLIHPGIDASALFADHLSE